MLLWMTNNVQLVLESLGIVLKLLNRFLNIRKISKYFSAAFRISMFDR